MKVLSQWLVLCLIPAFFYGCKDNGETKLPVQTSANNLVRTDSFEIKASTVKFDENLISLNPNAALIGNYTDPIMGKISAYTYFDFTLQREYNNFGTNVIVDSVYLEIPFHKYLFNKTKLATDTFSVANYIGDTTSNILFEVYRVLESFDADKKYKPSDDLPIESDPIAIVTGGAFPFRDKYFRVKLPISFGEEIIANSGVKNADFREILKGFCIKARSGNTGAIYSLNLNTSIAKVITYYQNNNSTRLNFNLLLSHISFNHISSDRSGTIVAGLDTKEIPSEELGNKSYVQSGTGVMTRFTFSSIEKFVNDHPSVIINKAVLKVPVDPSSYTGMGNYPNYYVQLLETNEDGSILLDENSNYTYVPNYLYTLNDTKSGAFKLSLENNYYIMDITGYFQDVVLGKKHMNQLLLAPVYGVSGANHSVILTNDSKIPIQFEVYYTQLK